MSNLKLGVDVVSAHNLLPKDGQGSSNAFVELFFDGHKFRNTIKEKDLNPVWNESFYFNISGPSNLHYLTLEAYVYNKVKATHSRSFLGKIIVTGNSFVPYCDAVVLHYPMEKHGIFSRVRGELGLKVYVMDDPTIKSSTPMPSSKSLTDHDPGLAHSQRVSASDRSSIRGEKSQARHTFHHLPNPGQESRHQHHASAAPDAHYIPQHEADRNHQMKSEKQPAKLVSIATCCLCAKRDEPLPRRWEGCWWTCYSRRQDRKYL